MPKVLKCDICRYGRLMKQGDVVETLVDTRNSEMFRFPKLEVKRYLEVQFLVSSTTFSKFLFA
jgi:hypothetical protein